jgi:hypothetical protein
MTLFKYIFKRTNKNIYIMSKVKIK